MPLSDLPSDEKPIDRLIAIMARLRDPESGCAWDLEQTFDTIKKYTLEETYEVFDAIERRAWPELKDELGDLLLQVLFYAPKVIITYWCVSYFFLQVSNCRFKLQVQMKKMQEDTKKRNEKKT